MSKPKLVNVDGGIGRCVCFTGALKKLAETNEVWVVSPWPEVFENLDFIKKVYHTNHKYLFEDIVIKCDYINIEPYHNHRFYTQELHLIQAINLLLNGSDEFINPILQITREEKQFAKDFVKEYRQQGKKIIAYQPFGSGAISLNENEEIFDKSNKSLTGDLASGFPVQYNTEAWINMTHIPSERFPRLSSTPLGEPYKSGLIQPPQMNLRQFIALVEECDFYVGVDSSVIHIAKAFNKKGVQLFGGTDPRNFAYEDNPIVCMKGFPFERIPLRFNSDKKEFNNRAMHWNSEEVEQVCKILEDF